MIDGIKLMLSLTDFEAWKQLTKIEFNRSVNDSGIIKQKVRTLNGQTQTTTIHRGEFETYRLTVKEVERKPIKGISITDYYLTIEGSLHKNHEGGTNYRPLTWNELQAEINHIEKYLHIPPNECEILNLEIGLNLPVSFEVRPFLDNLISFKGNQFSPYEKDSNGISLGYHCSLTQYSIKIYDKGKQNNLPEPLLRFERRHLKMQAIKKKGIKHLSDLEKIDKVYPLITLLLDSWDSVLFIEPEILNRQHQLTRSERKTIKDGENFRFWQRLKRENERQFYYQLSKFQAIQTNHGDRLHKTIRELISKEWDSLFQNCRNLPSGENANLQEFTVKVNGQFLQTRQTTPPAQVRVCQSCGRDISNQSPRSKFCSAKYVGYREAHKCRNMDSNPRNNLRSKIEMINRRGVLFEITPFMIQKRKC